MTSNVRRRFWVEATLTSLTGVLFLLTLFWRDWLEAVFGWDPDHHDGSAEWLLVAGLFVVTAALYAVTRMEWRRFTAARA
jgi:hypothetical protein